jgi:hypothetical protein
MFTLQPVAATREKQLRLWRDLLLEFHMACNKYMLVPSQCPLFTNAAINRTLAPQARAEVINYLVADGSAEWEDDARTRLRILWRKPGQLAGELYDYVRLCGCGFVCCVSFRLWWAEREGRPCSCCADLPARHARDCLHRLRAARGRRVSGRTYVFVALRSMFR